MNINDLKNSLGLDLQVYSNDQRVYIVYMLISSGKIVYVGKSDFQNVYSRIRAHANNEEKEFDSYCIIELDNNEAFAFDIEAGLISLIRPRYNKSGLKVSIPKIRIALNFLEGIGSGPIEQKTKNNFFDEELARSIISKHGLSPITLRSWRFRGGIPDRYLESQLQQIS